MHISTTYEDHVQAIAEAFAEAAQAAGALREAEDRKANADDKLAMARSTCRRFIEDQVAETIGHDEYMRLASEREGVDLSLLPSDGQ